MKVCVSVVCRLGARAPQAGCDGDSGGGTHGASLQLLRVGQVVRTPRGQW